MAGSAKTTLPGLWLFAFLLLMVVDIASGQTVQCCNTASGDWLKSPSAAACQARPGHVPYSPANTAQVMPCMQKTQQQAQDYMNKSGMMPKVSGLPTGALPPEAAKWLSGSQQPEAHPECCLAASGEWLGAMASEQCLAGDGQFPDIPDYLIETQSCRPATGGGAWSAEDFEDNIPNGDLEIWEDDNNPQSFAPFGIPAGAQGFEMETVFRSTDAHTGQYSARLQNFDMGEAVRKMGAPIVIELPGQAAGMNSCQDNCTLKSGQAPAGGGSLNETVLPISEAKPYFCGAYKGFIASQDQLNITAALVSGGTVSGGTDSGAAGHSNFTESSADWFTFALPFNTQGANLDNANGVIISAQVQPRNMIGQIQAGGMPAGVSTTTAINVDSFHFCELVNLTAYHPTVLTEGKQVALAETEEELGVQTFVNLDNDDKDGKFDLNDDDGVRADNELVKFQAVLPLNAKGLGEFKISGVDKHVRLWANANKSKPFEDANREMDIAELLHQDRAGTRLVRTFWIEGIAPSAKPRDVEIEFVFKNTALGGEEFRDKISMTVLGIESIVWKGRNNGINDDKSGDVLDEDPNWPKAFPGKAYRVFPGKRFVDGKPETEARNIVDVEVTLNVDPVRPINLHFRAFDMDDPTANGNEVDEEDAAEDNRGSTPNKWGGFPDKPGTEIRTLEFDSASATFEFQVTMQPGDNFAIVGSGDAASLLQLHNDDQVLTAIGPRHGMQIVDRHVFDATGSPGEAQVREHEKYVSDVLTVWRKLYMEIDNMGPVKGQQLEGVIKDFTPKGTDPKTKGQVWEVTLDINIYQSLPEDSKAANVGVKGSFLNGTANIHPWMADNQRYTIIDNTARDSGGDTLTLRFNPTWEPIDDSYRGKKIFFRDDDAFSEGDPLPPIPLERMEPTYAPAFVLPVDGKFSNSSGVAPFKLNTKSDKPANLRASYSFDNAHHDGDSDFWIIYLLNAYQGMLTEDGDGPGEGAIAGEADNTAGNNNGQGAHIYQESGRELAASRGNAPGWTLADAVAHEVGHLFTGDHAEEGLMFDPQDARNAGKADLRTQDFGTSTLVKIRSAKHP